jgi:DNA-binding transcriptional LysR family regulator
MWHIPDKLCGIANSADLGDLNAFVAVARARGFRDGARASGCSASGLSEAVRRLEEQLGVRLLHRTTRSVVPTEVGQRLLDRLGPALTEVEAALDVVNSFRDRPAGTLRLNVPVSAARLVLPAIVPPFLAAYPEIHLEVIADNTFVDVLAAGCDAGIRYEERLEQDMIAVPIGARVERFAAAAAPAYLICRGQPERPRELAAKLSPREPWKAVAGAFEVNMAQPGIAPTAVERFLDEQPTGLIAA